MRPTRAIVLEHVKNKRILHVDGQPGEWRAFKSGASADRLMAANPAFVPLPDGRKIAYQELGCRAPDVARSLVVLHGLMSSRRVAMGGASQNLLKDFGVRLIAIDRQGYGLSDPHPSQTFRTSCKDLEILMDALDLGEKIWLLGFSMGGAYAWAAARHIPHRLAAVAMVSPVGNFWWKGIPEEDQRAIVESYSFMDRLTSTFCKFSPFWMIESYTRLLSEVMLDPSVDISSGLALADRNCLQRPGAAASLYRDRVESLSRSRGFGIAKDYELLNKGWDFELADIGRVYKGKIHLWQGTEDTVVPVRLQRSAQKLLPEVIRLHELPGEGHLSWFCFNPEAPRHILETLSKQERLEMSMRR